MYLFRSVNPSRFPIKMTVIFTIVRAIPPSEGKLKVIRLFCPSPHCLMRSRSNERAICTSYVSHVTYRTRNNHSHPSKSFRRRAPNTVTHEYTTLSRTNNKNNHSGTPLMDPDRHAIASLDSSFLQNIFVRSLQWRSWTV